MSDSVVAEKRATVRHDCRLVSEFHGTVRVVRVFGCLDWTTAGEFGDLMRDECTDATLIVDLAATTRVDSVGTGHILAATALTKTRHQRLVMVVADPLLVEVLAATGLGAVVPIVASVSEALLWLDAQGTAGRGGPA